MQELEDRLEQVMGAQTKGQLTAVVRDLPTVPLSDERRQSGTDLKVGSSGIRPFTRHVLVPASVDRTRAVALQTIALGLNGFGYELVDQSPTTLKFERTLRVGSSRLATAVLFFPFGLVTLLARNRERIMISLEARGANETRMMIYGSASRKVRKGFAELTFG